MISPRFNPDTTSVFPPLLIPIVISVLIVSTFATIVVVVLLHEFRDPENPDQRTLALIPENAHSPLPDRGNCVPLPVIPDS